MTASTSASMSVSVTATVSVSPSPSGSEKPLVCLANNLLGVFNRDLTSLADVTIAEVSVSGLGFPIVRSSSGQLTAGTVGTSGSAGVFERTFGMFVQSSVSTSTGSIAGSVGSTGISGSSSLSRTVVGNVGTVYGIVKTPVLWYDNQEMFVRYSWLL